MFFFVLAILDYFFFSLKIIGNDFSTFKIVTSSTYTISLRTLLFVIIFEYAVM